MLMLSLTITYNSYAASLKNNQNEAACIAAAATKLVSINVLLTETSWKALS